MQLRRLLIGLASLFVFTASIHAEFKAGVFAQDVTPTKFPIGVNGNMTDVRATGVTDRLHARCMILDDGKTMLGFAVVDSCMVPRAVIEKAKAQVTAKLGIPASHLLISATHTHTAPTLDGVFQSDPDPDYPTYLAGKIAEGLITAHGKRVPAEIGWGVGSNPQQLFNRRWFIKSELPVADPFGIVRDRVRMNPGYQNPEVSKPAGPIDPDVTILGVRTKAGVPMALFANYSLHYVGGMQPLSADYFGMFAERVKSLLDIPENNKDFMAVMSNATSGDINNVNFAGPAPMAKRPGEQARIVADDVAKTALGVFKSLKYRDDLTLSAAAKDLSLGVRKPDAVALDRAKKILAAAKNPILQGLVEVYARETVLIDKYPDQVPVMIQAYRIGDVGVVAIPCEVFVDIGLELKAKSPLKPTFTVSLANGYNGYLPTPKHHTLGGYETWRARSSYLEVDASTKITATALELLKAVK